MSDWLKWNGEGISPVKSTQKVEVKFDDGAVLRGYGFDFEWWQLQCRGSDADALEYNR